MRYPVSMRKHIPNALTLARGLCGPVVFWLLWAGPERLAFSVFVIAALTDLVDGRLAASWGGNRKLGAILDPMADKLLGTCAWLGLWHLGWCPPWLVLAMLTRDALTACAWLLFSRQGLRFSSSMWGQIATSYEGASLGILLFHGPFLHTDWPSVGTWVGLAAMLTSLIAAAQYLNAWREFRRSQA